MPRLTVRKKQVIDSLVGGLPETAYQKEPFFSDLLKQPDVLIVPSPGKMIVTFAYSSPQRIGWPTALAWLEDFIEVKLNVGEYVITTALLFAESDEIAIRPDVRQLLAAAFDGFFLPWDWKPAFLDHALFEMLASLEPKREMGDFLREERHQVAKALTQFNPKRYALLADKRREPEVHPRELVALVMRRLALPHTGGLVEKPLVPNIKGYLGNLGKKYAFEFDLGRSGVAIEVMRAERHRSRERIRSLMAKARMLRYEIEGGQLHAHSAEFRPVLVVDGNLAGPDHDPYRYVRSLLAVGWELFGIDQLPMLAEMLRHGHV
jgi:hypothetical protein